MVWSDWKQLFLHIGRGHSQISCLRSHLYCVLSHELRSLNEVFLWIFWPLKKRLLSAQNRTFDLWHSLLGCYYLGWFCSLDSLRSLERWQKRSNLDDIGDNQTIIFLILSFCDVEVAVMYRKLLPFVIFLKKICQLNCMLWKYLSISSPNAW